MQRVPAGVRLSSAVRQQGLEGVRWGLTLALWCCGAVGCGSMEPVSSPPEEVATYAEALKVSNGLSVNGLSVNGLSVNGLSVNGLSVNGLSTVSFGDWFNQAPPQADVLMQYVVKCAMSSVESLSWLNPVTGVTHTWPGLLGLAPGWSAGLPASTAEQQLITACLAAHANKFGIHIPLSVLGRDGLGLPLAYTFSELSTYSEREACFFGNLFTGEGVFAANDRTLLRAGESTSRACGLSSRNGSTDCAPIVHVGSCKDFCTPDASRTYYTQCTYNGVSYRPLTTRILPADIYRCGDGVCQFTESCGTGTAYDSCMADCGACP